LPTDVLRVLDPAGVRVAITASRSVLGFMADIIFRCRSAVAAHRGPPPHHGCTSACSGSFGYVVYVREDQCEQAAAALDL
jgi:hypothetical protein